MLKNYGPLWKYLWLLLMVSLTILIINNIYEHKIPPVISDINSGVIGALLTAMVTLILLSNQTEKEQLNLKNSTVFEEKLKLFNEFLSILNESLKDGELKPEEIQTILFSFSRLRMHISNENAIKIATSIKLINEELFYTDENSIPDYSGFQNLYNNICSVLKSELYETPENKFEFFEFENLANVSYKPKQIINTISKFDDLLTLIRKNPIVLHKSKIRFKITGETINLFENSYCKIHNLIVSNISDYTMSLVCNKKLINNNEYLELPKVIITNNKKMKLVLSISEKNRVFVSLAKEQDEQAPEKIFKVQNVENESNINDLNHLLDIFM